MLIINILISFFPCLCFNKRRRKNPEQKLIPTLEPCANPFLHKSREKSFPICFEFCEERRTLYQQQIAAASLVPIPTEKLGKDSFLLEITRFDMFLIQYQPA